jgi:hypothetical protein
MKITKKTRTLIIYVIIFLLAVLFVGYFFFKWSTVEALTPGQTAAKAVKAAADAAAEGRNLNLDSATSDPVIAPAANALINLDMVASGINSGNANLISSGMTKLTALSGNTSAGRSSVPKTAADALTYSVSTVVDTAYQNAVTKITIDAYKNKNSPAAEVASNLQLPSGNSVVTAATFITNKQAANDLDKANNKAAATSLINLANNDKTGNVAKSIVAVYAGTQNKLNMLGSPLNEKPVIPSVLPKNAKGYDSTSIQPLTDTITTLSSDAVTLITGKIIAAAKNEQKDAIKDAQTKKP